MANLERDDVTLLFTAALNVCRPEHPYKDDPYPALPDEIETTWCQSRSSTIARCGARSGKYVAFFSCDISWIQSHSREDVLAVVNHEVAHVENTEDDSWHGPDFWQTVAEQARTIIDNIQVFNTFFDEPIDAEEFKEAVVEDINETVVDNRIETADERKEKMARDLALA